MLDDALAASNAGRYDEAIAGFQKALETNPMCAPCYYNIGYAYTQKKDYDNAETNYKKAIEQKADYADAYSGLANVYNAQNSEGYRYSFDFTQRGRLPGLPILPTIGVRALFE